MRIGDLARAAGMKVSTLRYYERSGVLRPTRRTSAGYRDYAEDAVQRVAFIRQARQIGFSVAEVRALINGHSRAADPRGVRVRDLIDAKLARLRTSRSSLEVLERELTAIRSRLIGSEAADVGIEALATTMFDKQVPKVSADVPGWHLAGSRPDSYEIGIIDDLRGGIAYLRSTMDPHTGFGTLMQQIAPDEWLGRRARLSAEVKADGVAGWAGLWMRVDGPRGMLAFDNMQSQPIKGTTKWTGHDIVLDVGEGATNVAFGVLLSGAGQVQIRQCVLDPVDHGVPTTAPARPTRAQNLDFTQRS